MVSDAVLLKRYARNRDAEAFAELVRRYAGVVYGTCLRVTQNPDDAEDASQESFLELARNAGSVTSSLPAWLHTVARNRAINMIRRDSTRRRHEEQAIMDQNSAEPGWSEIGPCVDQALGSLPEKLRVALIYHYMQGLSQTEVATRLKTSQPTVSRLLERGVAALRDRLKDMGVVVTAVLLAALLSENASAAAPQSLSAELGKMAMAGIGKPTAAAKTTGLLSGLAAVVTGIVGTLLGKLVLVGAGAGLLLALWTLTHSAPPKHHHHSTDQECRQRLAAVRANLREYKQRYGTLPPELIDTAKSDRYPDWCYCPTGYALYLYNPKRFPDRWVVCTLVEHRDF